VFALILMLAAALLGACDKHAQDKRDIRAAWDTYVKANQDQRAEEVVRLTAAATFDHYTKLLKTGLEMPAKDVWNLPPTQMGEVLRMRHRFKRSEIAGINGRGYVFLCASRGWVIQDDPTWKVTDIRIAENRATALVYNPEWEAQYARQSRSLMFVPRYRIPGISDKPPRYPLDLVKEDGAWKIDETATQSKQDEELRALAKFVRMSVRDMLMEIEGEETEGVKLPMSVWEPLRK
jgi:hypothetical protein